MTGSFTSMERKNINSLSTLYLDLVDSAKSSFKKLFDILSNNKDNAIYLSCSAGKDRTGVLVYSLFEIAGVDEKDIIDNYSESYENNKPRTKHFNLPDNYLYFMSSSHEEMEEFINNLFNKYGSGVKYLNSIGVTNNQIDKIRVNLIGNYK